MDETPKESDLQIVKNGQIRKVIKWDIVDEKLEVMAARGIIMFGGEIEEGNANLLFMRLTTYRLAHPNKPIWIVMNSPGGQVDEGLAIVDIIRAFVAMGTEINILCMGCIASMAGCILQAATNRYSLPHTQFMVHEVSQIIYAREKSSESEERSLEMKRINNIAMQIIADRSGKNKEELIVLTKKKDVWMSADEALKFGTNGLIDKIVNKLPFEI